MDVAPSAATYHAQRAGGEDRPLVWAHRGASARAPENTLAAFRLAAEQGADGIECDVMRCKSGELVVCHDEDLRRLCKLPVRVDELPLSELRRLRVLADRFPGFDESIPTLEEAVAAVGGKMRWNVELKVTRHDEAQALGRAAAEAFAKLPLEGRLLVSSFHPLALLTLRAEAPAIPTAYLFEGPKPTLWHRAWARATATAAIHPEAACVDEARVRRWHARGWAVNVWTVDEPSELLRLRDAGVDGVITNLPDVALATYRR